MPGLSYRQAPIYRLPNGALSLLAFPTVCTNPLAWTSAKRTVLPFVTWAIQRSTPGETWLKRAPSVGDRQAIW